MLGEETRLDSQGADERNASFDLNPVGTVKERSYWNMRTHFGGAGADFEVV